MSASRSAWDSYFEHTGSRRPEQLNFPMAASHRAIHVEMPVVKPVSSMRLSPKIYLFINPFSFIQLQISNSKYPVPLGDTAQICQNPLPIHMGLLIYSARFRGS